MKPAESEYIKVNIRWIKNENKSVQEEYFILTEDKKGGGGMDERKEENIKRAEQRNDTLIN